MRSNWLRPAGRWFALVVSITLVWRLIPWPRGPVLVPAVSPFVALASLIALRSVGLLCLVSAPVLLLALLSRRWFCRHACPLGLVQDMVGLLHRGRHAKWARWPRIGQWLVVLTLSGACLGYPLFLWLDPLAIFTGFASLWHWPLNLAAALSALGLPLVLLLTLVSPHLWCSRLCPLGALQEMMWIPRNTRGMGLSSMLSVLRQSLRLRANQRTHLARRSLLGAGFGVLVAFAARRTRAAAIPVRRPPGSVPEPNFTGICIRCSNCARACPHAIITPDLGQAGIVGLLCPTLDFHAAYCHENCNACGLVCPSGAISPLPLAVKQRRIIGIAEVDMGICRLAEGQECDACVAHCPFEALLIRSSDDGFSTMPMVLDGKCTGCGACESVCPVRPRRAIQVRPTASERAPARS